VDPEPEGFQPEAEGAMRGGMGGGGDCSNFNPTCNTCYWNNIEMDCALVMTFMGGAGNGGDFWAWEDGGTRLTPSPDEICPGCGSPDPLDPDQEPTDIYRTHRAETSGVWTWVPFNGNQAQPQNPERRLTPSEVAKVRGNLAEMLTDKCKSFINKLVSYIKGSPYDSGTQLLNDYDQVGKQGGIFFGPAATAGGAIANKNASVVIWNYLSGLKGYDTGYAAYTALHELIHVIVNRGDPALARDVFNAGLRTEPAPTKEEIEKDPLVTGRYWDGALKEACMPKGY
jgi:hypothetical protein